MPSTLPLSPLLGPMVSVLEHLCLQNSQTKFWKIPDHRKFHQTKPRCLCLKRFQCFNCYGTTRFHKKFGPNLSLGQIRATS